MGQKIWILAAVVGVTVLGIASIVTPGQKNAGASETLQAAQSGDRFDGSLYPTSHELITARFIPSAHQRGEGSSSWLGYVDENGNPAPPPPGWVPEGAKEQKGLPEPTITKRADGTIEMVFNGRYKNYSRGVVNPDGTTSVYCESHEDDAHGQTAKGGTE